MWRRTSALLWRGAGGREAVAVTAGEHAAAVPDILAPPTAFLRLAASRPYMLPEDSSLESFLSWCIAHGGDAGSEFVLDDYADVCELAGWALPGIAPPVVDTMAPDGPAPAFVRAVQPALAGPEAALAFAIWVRETDQCGTYTSDDLAVLYSTHAAEIGRAETPLNMLRKHLKLLPGVEYRMAEKPLRGGNRAERRERSMRYVIAPLAAANEPMRLAA